MEIEDLLKSVVGPNNASPCSVEKPIQPDDDVGKFGNTPDILVKATDEGGVEIDSKEMAVKLSKDILEAIKTFVSKGDD